MRRLLQLAACSTASLLLLAGTAAPAAATTKQTTLLPPIDGKVTSAPDEPHWTPYTGDYSYDIAGTGAVHARFRNTNGTLSLTVAAIGRACASGNFADGGDRIVLNVIIDGAKVGTVTYSHLTRFPITSGNVPVGARIGDIATGSDGLRITDANRCWKGAHVHVEPRNDSKYGCYFRGLLGSVVTASNPLGIVGGERAGAANVACPSDAETPGTGGGGTPSTPTAATGADGANLRADVNTSAEVLTTIPARTTIALECWRRGQGVQASTGTYTLWHRTTYNGRQGFVSDSTLNTPAFPNAGADQPAPGEPECPAAGPPPAPKTSTSGNGANVRADATTDSAILTTIPGNTPVTLECWRRGQGVQASTGTYSLWHRTTYNGAQGFVSDSTLNTPAFPDPAADQPAPGEPECPAATPVVSPRIAVTPTSGDHGTLFQGTGAGFSPGTTARLTAYAPGGGEYSAAYTRERAVDANGAFSWTWKWDPGDPDGVYRFVFADSSGPTAETSLTITPDAPPGPQPEGVVLGFDTFSAPSVAQMRAWTASPYDAVGVYIPVKAAESDNRLDKQQANLTPAWVSEVGAMGYQVLPIYLGKQAPEACFPADYWRMSADPATARQQGRAAAADADASADALGIANSTPVVHDTEAFGNGCDAAVSAYLGGWTEGLHDAGRRSAVYGSQGSTTRVLRDLGTRPSPAPDAIWAATDNGQANTSSLGSTYADWQGRLGNQYALDVSETHGGVTLPIDRNAFDSAFLSSAAPSPSPPATVARLSGADRLGTAVAISKDAWADQAAQSVVLGRHDAFPDALAGTPLAAEKDGPLLLTPSTGLDAAIASEIKRVLPAGRTVYLLGGPTALSPGVADAVARLGYAVSRLGGADRYATAVAISKQLGTPSKIFEATGLSFQNALISGVAAAGTGGVVVLTADGQMPAATRAYLDSLPGVERIAVGPQAGTADPSATRIAGSTVYDTARLVAERFFPAPGAAAVASGTVFADALSGGAHIARLGGPLLLSEPTRLPAPIAGYLSSQQASIDTVTLYGGTVALSASVEEGVRSNLRR